MQRSRWCPVFRDRATALDCLVSVAQGEPESAAEVFLIAQDDDGNPVGEAILERNRIRSPQSPARLKRRQDPSS